MTAGDAEGNPGDHHPYDEPKSVQPSPVVDDDKMERQRRYGARKRLDGDMKSSSLGQNGLPPSEEALPYGISIGVNPCQPVAHKNEACVYSGRNWKRDARRTHLFKELTDPSNVPGVSSPSVKPPFEAGSHLESHRKPAAKRDWKADARSKAVVDVGNRENHPTA